MPKYSSDTKQKLFLENPAINPETGKAIKIGGPTYLEYVRKYATLTQNQCEEWLEDPSKIPFGISPLTFTKEHILYNEFKEQCSRFNINIVLKENITNYLTGRHTNIPDDVLQNVLHRMSTLDISNFIEANKINVGVIPNIMQKIGYNNLEITKISSKQRDYAISFRHIYKPYFVNYVGSIGFPYWKKDSTPLFPVNIKFDSPIFNDNKITIYIDFKSQSTFKILSNYMKIPTSLLPIEYYRSILNVIFSILHLNLKTFAEFAKTSIHKFTPENLKIYMNKLERVKALALQLKISYEFNFPIHYKGELVELNKVPVHTLVPITKTSRDYIKINPNMRPISPDSPLKTLSRTPSSHSSDINTDPENYGENSMTGYSRGIGWQSPEEEDRFNREIRGIKIDRRRTARLDIINAPIRVKNWDKASRREAQMENPENYRVETRVTPVSIVIQIEKLFNLGEDIIYKSNLLDTTPNTIIINVPVDNSYKFAEKLVKHNAMKDIMNAIYTILKSNDILKDRAANIIKYKINNVAVDTMYGKIETL